MVKEGLVALGPGTFCGKMDNGEIRTSFLICGGYGKLKVLVLNTRYAFIPFVVSAIAKFVHKIVFGMFAASSD